MKIRGESSDGPAGIRRGGADERHPLVDEQVRVRASRPGSVAVMHQKWRSLLFLHWSVPLERVQATLPKGLYADPFDGVAWVGVIPFRMEGVRPIFCPAVPGLSSFNELNVRTYVCDSEGNPGVWFYALECDQPVAVWIARTFFRLNYIRARMSMEGRDRIRYRSRRHRSSSAASFEYRAIGDAVEAERGSFEFFALERYLLYARRPRDGALFRGRVTHPPYRYRQVELTDWSPVPAYHEGFMELVEPPEHRCMVEGFDVAIHPLERV